MLELFYLNLSLFQFRPGRLVFLSLAAAILKASFAQFLKAQCPGTNMLITDLLLDCQLSVGLP